MIFFATVFACKLNSKKLQTDHASKALHREELEADEQPKQEAFQVTPLLIMQLCTQDPKAKSSNCY